MCLIASKCWGNRPCQAGSNRGVALDVPSHWLGCDFPIPGESNSFLDKIHSSGDVKLSSYLNKHQVLHLGRDRKPTLSIFL